MFELQVELEQDITDDYAYDSFSLNEAYKFRLYLDELLKNVLAHFQNQHSTLLNFKRLAIQNILNYTREKVKDIFFPLTKGMSAWLILTTELRYHDIEESFLFSYRHQLPKFAEEKESSGQQSKSSENKPREETNALSRKEIFHEDESKYATILTAGRERRSKFEELQAASKNLERRLHEDDDYRRRQEMERRMSKEKPLRYNSIYV